MTSDGHSFHIQKVTTRHHDINYHNTNHSAVSYQPAILFCLSDKN